ncbi:pre-mRNA-splicing factor CWC22 homolog [Eubalaena glacialis]|uniref:pre-mRNA-splicing factor CWC22 homolog n=1 Tax=Eubalaena glacialis TaxID=27606 RepID=UPI002A59E963|nr:pre-mRNA-splicing factor CWC22 homolog [Eubalaena glacialis]XP_061041479.1 pre-mRNA-splicing factor CWC22 homolog [Eubalaena glacialis]XP_061041488.1 pre-mRNA-splicing factor CWC22 homolog [Eubalaena glacialis]XP_061041495.1 pre-mRNA-splicing factor CWC22 homolog [Eubalaena glacialis]
MKSSVAQIKHSSSHDRRENYNSYQRTSSPEDRYTEQERSPRDRDYFDYSRSDYEHSRRGRSYDDSMESRSRDREKRRERDVDRKRSRKSPSPGRRSPEPLVTQSSSAQDEPTAKKKKEELDPLLTRTGGAYIPPAKLRMMQEQITDKNSLAYQRMSWEALKKSINGLINKVNISNIGIIIQELLQENIVRGRGLLSRSVLQAQSASPIFTHVYAALVAIINSKFPQIGELILKRLILNFRKGYRRNDKPLCLTASKFVAHLINQNVAHEVLCLEMLTLLLERPTDDSVEVAIGFLKECGLKLTQVSPRGINAIFERLRNILHESEIDKRVQYMIEVMFAVRKDGFKDHPVVLEGLDLVEEDDQFTHMLPLEDDYNPEDVLNVFKMDPNFMENEEKYKTIKKEILDEGDSDSNTDQDAGSSEEEEEEEEEEGEEDEEGQTVTIHDKTEINLVSFRRTIYLAIQSSLDFEECAHKLLKMEFPEGQTKELCNMILDCCAQQRTYEKFFGLLAGRFCMLKKEYMESFESIFKEQYDTIHRLETNKLRNVAKMFAHLLYTDSLPWSVLECIKLSEETTTSSSRIFVKIFFQELCEYMGLPKLNGRLKDETLQPFFEGLLPRDNPRNTRFAINFFTSIGLGGLTDELREHLKNTPKVIVAQKPDVEPNKSSPSSSSSASSSSESDSSASGSDSSDSSSESSSEESDSSSTGSQSSASDKDVRKKGQGNHRRKEVNKLIRKQHTNDRKQEERRPEQRHQETRTERERRSEKPRDRDSRDPVTKYTSDRGLPSERNSYSRAMKDREQEMYMDLEHNLGDPKKKRGERRNSFSENERKYRNKDSENFRRKDRSKSREKDKKHSASRSDEDRYQNGAERRWEKSSQYSEQSRESKKNQDRRREKSPTKQKK